jgi:hypothetical protein
MPIIKIPFNSTGNYVTIARCAARYAPMLFFKEIMVLSMLCIRKDAWSVEHVK